MTRSVFRLTAIFIALFGASPTHASLYSCIHLFQLIHFLTFCVQGSGSSASAKAVAREGENSLLLSQNPSVFSVYYRMRNLLLQEQLVGRFNNRLMTDIGEAGEGEEDEGQGWEDEDAGGVEISKVWRGVENECVRGLVALRSCVRGVYLAALSPFAGRWCLWASRGCLRW